MAVAGAFMLLMAGCLAPASTTPTLDLSPTFTLIPVSSGTALVLRPVPVDGSSFSLDIDQTDNYGNAGPRTEDSYACFATLTKEGWWPDSSRPFIGPFIGRRQGNQTTWAGIAIGNAQGTHGPGFAGSETDSFVMVGHEKIGPTVNSSVVVRPERGAIESVATGRFWCLDGPSQFQSGDYLVTDQGIQAQGLSWSETFSAGPVVRVRATANTTGLRLEGPDGRQEIPAELWEDGFLDATFCSAHAGDWRLSVDRLEANRPSSFKVQLFDATLPGLACAGIWTASADASAPRQ
ncbi:MAG: hypothetical protein LC623_03790 [Halobacteriales archaeon]|nr:hypothetical protein [Halobacteriales archaeon]